MPHWLAADLRVVEGLKVLPLLTPTKKLVSWAFSAGKAVGADRNEEGKRLIVAGFVSQVVRPVQRATLAVYAQGYDL